MKYEKLKEVNNKLKTIDVKGKGYVEVNQRILAFRELFENGRITTELKYLENGMCVIQAYIYDGDILLATGIAYEKEGSTFINKTSYIENCETSAVGRALGILGIGIETSIASAEEVANAIVQQESEKVIDKTHHEALVSSINKNNIEDEKVLEVISKYGYASTSEVKMKDYGNIINDFRKLIGDK